MMEASGAYAVNTSNYYIDNQKKENKTVVPVNIYEATAALRNITEYIAKQPTHTTRDRQNFNTVAEIESILAAQPEICAVYYNSFAKAAGLMIMNKIRSFSGCEIAGIITDNTDESIEKALTEYAVNLSYNESEHGGRVFFKTTDYHLGNAFKRFDFKYNEPVELFLDPSHSTRWQFKNNHWSVVDDKENNETSRAQQTLRLGSDNIYNTPAIPHKVRPSTLRQGLTLELTLAEPSIHQPVGYSPKAPSTPPSVVAALSSKLLSTASAKAKALHAHLHRAQQYIGDKLQPDLNMLMQDTLVATAIIESENESRPNLNLTLCDSISDVIAELEDTIKPFHKRFIFRDTNISQHYILADVSVNAAASASILLFESAELGSLSGYSLYKKFSAEMNKTTTFPHLRMGIFDVDSQRSPADCLIFCISYARSAQKHADLLDGYHDLQHSDTLDSQYEFNSKNDLFAKIGFNIYSSSILPVDFIKHSHSSSVIDKWLDSSSPRDIPAQNILSEKKQYREDRFTENGIRSYLTSIEYERQRLIARAFHAEMAKEDHQTYRDKLE